MLIDLKAYAKGGQRETIQVELNTRMPNRVISPCSLNCSYAVRAMTNYFLVTLEVQGELTIKCQRCLKQFTYDYSNETNLAICDSEAYAQELMSDYDCIVTKNSIVNLVELVTDELHLYSPECHPNIAECDKEVSKFIHFSTKADD